MLPFLPSFRRFRLLSYGMLFLLASLIAVLLTHGWGCYDQGIGSPEVTASCFFSRRTSPQAGGVTTLSNRSSHGFALPAAGLTAAESDLHTRGDVAFDAVFVTAPARLNPGLGPLFNNTSCAGCHIKNGRGMPEMGQALVRVSLPVTGAMAVNPIDGVVPVPGVGAQIQDQGIYGYQPEARVKLTWREQPGAYPDGQTYGLRTPQMEFRVPVGKLPLPEAVLTSLRIPPPVFGAGLLEAIPERTLSKLADPDDRNRDGISGRLNHVWRMETATAAVGRFGWKANSPTLLSQTAAAYRNDMGVGSPLLADEEGNQDIDQRTLEAATFYVQTLGVPARTQIDDPTVRQGEKLFAQANCTACHVATLRTGQAAIAALAHQTIHPYTDLLLHDMGPGLADGRPDFAADGQEWRTAPLWGLGLTQTVLPYSGYLHDGRARTVEEAILWHDGEAAAAKQQFMAMDRPQRAALFRFLNSL